MRIHAYAIMGGALLALAACGDTPLERGATGAGIGAGVGAAGAAVTGNDVSDSALIGAAIGGATGVLTDENTIDLGDPFWE